MSIFYADKISSHPANTEFGEASHEIIFLKGMYYNIASDTFKNGIWQTLNDVIFFSQVLP